MKAIKFMMMAAIGTMLASCSCDKCQAPVLAEGQAVIDTTQFTAAPHGAVCEGAGGQIVYTQDITTQSGNFVYDADSEWERTPDPGEVYRKVMGYNDNMMMVKVKFKAGSEGAMHSHPHVQITYVESGAFEFTINGVSKVVRAGDVLMKEPNVVHGCKCLEDGMLIDTFTPMRSTFLAQ